MVLCIKGEERLAPGIQGSRPVLHIIYLVVWRYWELEDSTLLPRGEKLTGQRSPIVGWKRTLNFAGRATT